MEQQYSIEHLLGELNNIEKKNAPTELFITGDATLFSIHPRISVVGSRKVSEEGVKRTRSLTRQLVEQGAVVVSGLAEGVDKVAHETTIDSGGRTIAVLGTPLDQTYPKSNAQLQAIIMATHLAVSQFAYGQSIQKKNFPIRNRTMALISDCTIIVEAQDGSGSLHQGWEALRLGRPLGILESSASNTTLEWPKEFIKYGAIILSRDNLDDLFQMLPWGRREEVHELPF